MSSVRALSPVLASREAICVRHVASAARASRSVPGRRKIPMTMAPSESRGMNSQPRLRATKTAASCSPMASRMTATRKWSAISRTGV